MLKRIFLSALFAAAVAVCFQSVGLGAAPSGDKDDGSRTEHPHLMYLFAESGELEKGTDAPIPTKVMPSDEITRPFSTRLTCGQCHTYEDVQKGWHFNYTDPNVDAGRPGHPWLLVDWRTGTQIPVSYRDWPGAFTPAELGLSSWDFIRGAKVADLTAFGRQIPGGGAGELEAEGADAVRQMVSGKLEINCLACHNADSGQDMMEAFGWTKQIAAENFRWAAAASSEFCTVTGAAKSQDMFYDPFMEEAVKTTYRPGTFDDSGRVLFDVGGKPLNRRCYYCHSTTNIAQDKKWAEDTDIHLTAGLACVDCHREGNEHRTIRGYEREHNVGDPNLAKATTCKGCHIPDENASVPHVGRLGAPVPAHKGIPVVHFDRLTCTACHSGLYPKADVQRVKTSIGHGLGLQSLNRSEQMLPHIQTPVFAVNEDGKIAPFNAVWPAYWGTMNDSNVVPLEFETVISAVTGLLSGKMPEHKDDWPTFTDEQISRALAGLAQSGVVEGKPVYVTGGRVLSLGESGNLTAQEHPAAQPYLWAVGHNVRPAAQSLGARSCEECHSKGSAFFFGEVAMDSPVESVAAAAVPMYALQKTERPLTDLYVNRFFRWLIIIVMALLIMHISGDLFRRAVNRIFSK